MTLTPPESGAGHVGAASPPAAATVRGMKAFALTVALLGGAALAQTAPAPATPAQTAPTQTTSAQTTPAQDPQTVVARIGGQTLTLADFDREFRLAVAQLANAQGLPFSEELLAQFAEARGSYLNQFVRDQVLAQLARVSVKPDTAAIDQQIADARAEFETEAEFDEAIAGAGYSSPDVLRAALERQATVRPYLEGIQKRFTFGDAIVASFYSLNRGAFQRDAEACVKHILVPTKAEGETVLKDLASGQDFAAIAKAKSQDPGSAAQGGDLGCIAPGDTVESFDKASFNAPLNQPQLVQSEYGWHVLTVTRRTQAGTLPLAEAAPLIREQLAREAAQKYLDTQIARVKVETFPDVLKAQPADR